MLGSPKRVRLLFGFEAVDWLFLVGGVALAGRAREADERNVGAPLD